MPLGFAFAFVWSIARRYLFATDANGRPALVPYIGMIGVALGVMVLIVVNAIYAGYGEAIQRRLLATSGHLVIQGAGGTLEDWRSVSDSVHQAVPDQTRLDVFPAIQRQVLLRRVVVKQDTDAAVDLTDPLAALFAEVDESGNGSSDGNNATASRAGRDQGAQLSAYHPAALQQKFDFAEDVVAALERGELVLGRRLAEAMGVEAGQELRVVAPPPDPSSADPELQSAISVTLRVGALADFGLYIADAGWAVLSYDKAAEVLKAHGQSDSLEIFFDDLRQVDQLGPAIQQQIGFGFLLYNMKDQVARQTAYIRQEQQLIALVVGMTLLVASVGIVSGLVMLVHDKRREIAVIRTMGARQRDILAVFLLAGGGIGVIGLAIGVSLGCLIALNANDIRLFFEGVTGTELFPVQHFNITQLPSKLEGGAVGLTSLFAIVLVLIAALYPAWRASKVDPALGVKGA